MKKSNEQTETKPCTIHGVSVAKRTVCDNYINGFYAEYGTDCCVNCGQRKGKHEQTER